MVELRGLEKRWPALRIRADLSVDRGSFFTLLGPSGCGKSTLLRLIAGLEKPDAGSVLIDGRDVTDLPPRERGVGIVFQDYALFPHLRAEDNVAYGLAVRGLPRRERREKARALLGVLGLAGFGGRWPDSLSGGERQRVALARTLAIEPSVVLFDEPLSSLDATLRRRLREELRDQQKRLGFTAILVTHDLEEAMAVSDRIAVMEDGRVHTPLSPPELWDSPPTASVARFLGHGTVLPVESLQAEPGGFRARTKAGIFHVSSSPRADTEDLPSSPSGWALFLPEDAFDPVGKECPESEVLSAVCESSDFSGSVWIGRFNASGTRLRVALSRKAAPVAGKTLRLRLEPGRARLIRETSI